MALHPLKNENLELMLKWRNAPDVRKNMYTSHIISKEEHQAWFEKIKNNKSSQWFIFHEKSGEPAGVVYFTDINDRSRSAFWGFYAAESALRGVGSRMEYEALEHAFEKYKLHKLNCEILASNTKVISLHEKFGFSKEGVFRDFHFNGNEYVDVVRMGILANEWSDKRQAMLERLARFL